MVIVAIHAAIEALLANDATFVAAIRALNLGTGGVAATPKVMKSLRDPQQVGQENYPAWLIEKGDSAAESLSNDGTEFGVIGFTQQGMASDILIGLVWHQQDAAVAYGQRLGLEAAFVDLFLRNPAPGGATIAWARELKFDRGALHPTQTALATIRVEYAQARLP